MKRGRGLGDDGKYSVLCYFTRWDSVGMDDAASFTTEAAAMRFARKCVKDGKGTNAHAVVSNPYVGLQKTVKRRRKLSI